MINNKTKCYENEFFKKEEQTGVILKSESQD